MVFNPTFKNNLYIETPVGIDVEIILLFCLYYENKLYIYYKEMCTPNPEMYVDIY